MFVTDKDLRAEKWAALEKRLNNSERVLIGMWALMKDHFPAETKDAVSAMMESYFNANMDLGGDFTELILFLQQKDQSMAEEQS